MICLRIPQGSPSAKLRLQGKGRGRTKEQIRGGGQNSLLTLYIICIAKLPRREGQMLPLNGLLLNL